MSVTRFDPWYEHGKMTPEDDGDYVLYSDHIAAIKQLREALKKVDERLCGRQSVSEEDWQALGCLIPVVRAALEATKEGR
jgi:hypothetical protein